MAIKGNYKGIVISRINNIGSDATPKRVVVLDASDPDGFTTPSGAGVFPLGGLVRDLRFESGFTPDGHSGNIQISGVMDLECKGTITAWHFVKIGDTAGLLSDAGAVDSLSDGATQTNVVGIALESGTAGSYISVWLNPSVIFLA